MKQIRLTVQKHYPAAWVFHYAPIPAGTVVPVVEATNLPQLTAGPRYWINTEELKDDAYGILVEPGEYIEVAD